MTTKTPKEVEELFACIDEQRRASRGRRLILHWWRSTLLRGAVAAHRDLMTRWLEMSTELENLTEALMVTNAKHATLQSDHDREVWDLYDQLRSAKTGLRANIETVARLTALNDELTRELFALKETR